MIPEKAQQKVNEAVVIAVGPGAKNKVETHVYCMFNFCRFCKPQMFCIYINTLSFVTGFAKICMDHTSNFAHFRCGHSICHNVKL